MPNPGAFNYGLQPGAFPTPGPSSYPPNFSYGLPQGMGSGGTPTAIGAAAVGNIPTLLSTAGMVGGIGSMFSAAPVFGHLAMLDPFSAAGVGAWNAGSAALASGAGVGGVLGAGAAAGLPLFAASMVGMGAVSAVGKQFMTGASQQQQLNAQLSGIGFANPMATLGRGFSPMQSREIGAMMRQYTAADPFTSTADLTQLMDQFTGMQMHRGVQDAREFASKFKQFTEAVKTIAMELGTTLEEAGRLHGAMRQSGFYTARDVLGNSRSMQTASGLGMSSDVFLGTQAGGAGIARGMELTGRAGALSSTRFAQDLLIGATQRSAGGTGIFRDEQLMDITGASTGAEAAGILGNQFTGAMAQYLRSAPGGRAFLAGVGRQAEGRFTGEIDAEQLSRLAGGADLREVSAQGRGRLTNSRLRGSFVTQEHKIASALLESQQGQDAIIASMEQTARELTRGQVSDEDAVALLLEKQLGMDKRMAEIVAESFKHSSENRGKWLRKMREEQAANELRLELRRNYTYEGISKRVTGTISDFFAPVRQAGADFSTDMSSLSRNAIDFTLGVDRAEMRPDVVQASLRRLVSGEGQMAPATAPRLSDFSYRSAAQLMAQQTSPQQAMRTQLEISSGVTPTLAKLGITGSTEAKLTEFMSGPGGKIVREALADAQNARAVGNDVAADRAMARARAAINSAIPAGSASFGEMLARGADNMKGRDARADLLLAGAALQSGQLGIARELSGAGEVSTHTFGDVKATTQTARRMLGRAGITGDLAEGFATGGAGAELFARIASTGNGDFFTGLAARPDVAARLDAAGTDRLGELAKITSEELGGNFSAEDVRAAMKGLGQYQEFRAKDRFGVNQALQSGEALRTSGQSVLASSDTRVGRAALSATAAALTSQMATASAEMRPAYEKAIQTLSDVESGTIGADQIGPTLNALLQGAQGTTGELGDLAKKRSRALSAAAAGNIEGVSGIYGGVTEEELRKLVGASPGTHLSSGQLEEAVQSLAAQDLLGQMAAGNTGSMGRRGVSAEEQLAQDLRTTSAQVQATAQAVQKLVDGINGAMTEGPADAPTDIYQMARKAAGI